MDKDAWEQRWQRALGTRNPRMRGAAIGALITAEDTAVRRAILQDFADEILKNNSRLSNSSMAPLVLRRARGAYPKLFRKMSVRAVRRHLTVG